MWLRLSYAPQCLNITAFSLLKDAFSHHIYCKKIKPYNCLWDNHKTGKIFTRISFVTSALYTSRAVPI